MGAKCFSIKNHFQRGRSVRTRALSGVVVLSLALSFAMVASAATSTVSAAASRAKSSSKSAAGSGQTSSDLASPSASSGCPSKACSSVLKAVAAAAKIETLPANLTPKLQDAESDIHVPPGGTCGSLGISGVSPNYEPCTWNSSGSSKIVLLGESHAWQWSTPIETVAQNNGEAFALLYHSSCNVVLTAASLPVQGAVGQAPSGSECVQWLKAALKWIVAYKPQMVIVTTVNGFDVPKQESTYLKGLHEVFQRLHAPGRRLVMLQDMPLPGQSGPQCLAAHESHVQSCSTSEPDAVKTLLRYKSFARQISTLKPLGASFVNVIPWFCTKKICPAVIGNYEVYQDPFHATTTYAEHLAPVMAVALGLKSTS